jgi:hypothetical protein
MVLTAPVVSLLLSGTTVRHGSYAIPVNGVVAVIVYGIVSLVAIPFSILLNRYVNHFTIHFLLNRHRHSSAVQS